MFDKRIEVDLEPSTHSGALRETNGVHDATAKKLTSPVRAPEQKPTNDFAGLRKHFFADFRAALVMAPVSIVFCLAVAQLSHFPYEVGLMSAIVSGPVYMWAWGRRGCFVGIAGPAAALAPLLVWGMGTLGNGDEAIGRPLLCCAIVVAAFMQTIVAWFKWARFAGIFPASMMHGMLAGIGAMIIIGKVGDLFVDATVCALGIGCLGGLFILDLLREKMKLSLLEKIPPHAIVIAGGLIVGQFIGLDASHLIDVPALTTDVIKLPDFSPISSGSWMFVVLFVWVSFKIALIDTAEVTSTAQAVDEIDPYQRTSDLNQTVGKTAIANGINAFVFGAMTVILGGVKSTLNVLLGARTMWANFFNAMIILAIVLWGRGLINLMPLAVMSAVLIYTGWEMLHPKKWKHAYHIGKEQFVVFGVTAITTAASKDLLLGIMIGTALKFMILLVEGLWAHAQFSDDMTPWKSVFQLALGMLRSPVKNSTYEGGVYQMYLGHEKSHFICCFNSPHLRSELEKIPADAQEVFIVITEDIYVVDSTCSKILQKVVEEIDGSGRDIRLIGWDGFQSNGHHDHAFRARRPVFRQKETNPVMVD